MQYGGKYWNIKKYLPYQRNFNFIDSERSIGKTYTTLGYFFERALTKGEQFVYIVRTQDDRKEGALSEACSKVILKEYPEYKFKFSSKTVGLMEGKNEVLTLGYCIALSEANSKKRLNLPNVRWLIFDEYIVDEKDSRAYVQGWREPELFLKLYHTIDREEDRVTCFLLANNISFYNPYHLHPAFNIPKTPKNQIWKNENVLYHWTEATEQLKAEKKSSKFLRMIEGTEYGDYAINGNFVNDDDTLVEKRTGSSQLEFIFYANQNIFGVWYDRKLGKVYIDNKYNANCPFKYTFDLSCKDVNAILIKGKTIPYIKWLGTQFRQKQVRFSNQEVYAKTFEFLYKIA